MQSTKGSLHSLPSAINDRDELDRYWTPKYVTQELLRHVKFNGSVLEPANGNGHISDVLKEAGYEVETADITTGQDFFLRTERAENIVTNPPYGKVNEFIAHCIKIATKKVALMCRLHVLVSKGRFAMFKEVPHCHVIVFTTPIMQPLPDGGWKKGSAFTHCWLILDLEGEKRQNTFEWVQFDKHHPCD